MILIPLIRWIVRKLRARGARAGAGMGRDGPEDQAVVTAALPVPRRAGVAGAGRPSMGPASLAVTRGMS